MLLKASKENGYRPEENLNFETQARGQHDAKMFWGSLELLNRLSQALSWGQRQSYVKFGSKWVL